MDSTTLIVLSEHVHIKHISKISIKLYIYVDKNTARIMLKAFKLDSKYYKT